MEKHSCYKELTISSGDLIAWTNTDSFYLKIVRLFTLSEYTHVGVAVVENGEIYVVEANRPKVEKNKLSVRTPIYHIPMDVDFTKESSELLHSYIGKKYSVLQAALSYIGVYINDDKWYCTELAYDFYDKLGFKFKKRLTPTKFVKQAITNYNKQLNYIESV